MNIELTTRDEKRLTSATLEHSHVYIEVDG